MGSSELAIVGLTCSLIGVFFLANSIIFRKLRKVIQEFFGVRSRSIRAIKDYTLNNIQVALGFLFLAVGFLLEIYSRLGGVENGAWLLSACVGLVVLAVILYLAGAVYSRRSFKTYLRQFFLENPECFRMDSVSTKDIGEFLGIPHNPDMTVEDYTEQVRRALGLGEGGGRGTVTRPVTRREGLARGRVV